MTSTLHTPVHGMARHASARVDAVDFDVCGIVGVRLLDASPADVAAVARQLGPPAQPGLAREPELVVRFVDGRVVARVPFATLGRSCEVTRARVLRDGVPLLVPLVNLMALARGWIPLHASAFVRDGVGVLTVGRAHGGKTAMLLAFASRGATYVGDDWCYVSPDGAEVRGLAQVVGVRDAYLRQLPGLRARLEDGQGAGARARSGAFRLLGRAERALPASRRAPVREGVLAGLRRRVRGLVEWKLTAHATATELFGQAAVASAGPLDVLLLTRAGRSSGVHVRAAEPATVAHRVAGCMEPEWRELLDHYECHRVAFPGARNPLIEELDRRQHALLARALAGKPAYVVEHPSPAPLEALHEAVSPLLTPRA